MVDERALESLIVSDGDRVTCLGDIERSSGSVLTLWASRSWEPGRTSRSVNSDIDVEMGVGVGLPLEGSIVLVTGTWRQGVIVDAHWAPPDTVEQPMLPGSPDKLRPADTLDLRQAFMEGIEADASDEYLISGGGTVDAAWLWLRTMSPAIAERVISYPGRVDVFTAVTPVRVGGSTLRFSPLTAN